MKDQATINNIRQHAKRIFATQGYDGLSMRALSAESDVGLSSIYHFFADKDVLLQDVYTRTNTRLGAERQKLPVRRDVERMLNDLVIFQFEHAEDVVFVLKYYLHYRHTFLNLPDKILPPKAYLHIEEILHKGIAAGAFHVAGKEIPAQSRIITHAINGFLLEYHPYEPPAAERRLLARQITDFVMHSLKYEEVPMEQR